MDDDKSYYSLRQIESISNNGHLIIEDNLSFGGRTNIIMPVYYYIMGLFYKLIPSIVFLKIINNLFASSLIIVTYLITSKIIKSRKISLVASIVSATTPYYIIETINRLNPNSILIPCIFFSIYQFLNLEKKSTLDYLIILTILVILSSSYSLIFVLGIIIFLTLNYIDNIKLKQIEIEYISFLLLFFLWVNFIIYKNAFLMHGFSVIWGNSPIIINKTSVNMFEIITNIGIIPLLLGIFAIYKYLFKKKSKNVMMFIGLTLSSMCLILINYLPQSLGLSCVGISLVFLFSISLRDIISEFKKTKFGQHENLFFIGVILILLITQIIPSIYLMSEKIKDTHNKEYISGFIWLNNLNENVTILSLPEEGHLITYFGKHKNVIDTNFLLIEDIEIRYSEVLSFYSQKFKINALRILDKYDAEYFIISPKLKKYNINNTIFMEDECFDIIYKGEIEVYKQNKKKCNLDNEK